MALIFSAYFKKLNQNKQAKVCMKLNSIAQFYQGYIITKAIAVKQHWWNCKYWVFQAIKDHENYIPILLIAETQNP